MTLTKKDLQSIKDIIQETVENTVLESELRIKEFVRSEFRVQNMVLDTRFRAIDSRFDSLESAI